MGKNRFGYQGNLETLDNNLKPVLFKNKAGFYFAFIPILLYNLIVESKIFLLFMPLDEQLIARSNSWGNEENDSVVKSGEFRKSVRGGNSSSYSKDEDNYNESEKEDFRSNRIAALRQKVNENLKNKIEKKTLSPAKQAMSSLLKSAWTNLIPSFGLTLIWINIHVCLRYVLGKELFCSLGEEWLPKGMPSNPEGVKKNAVILERIGLFLLDLVAMLVVLVLLSIIAMIVSGISNPLKAIRALFGGIWCAAIGGCNKDNSTSDMIISFINTISNTYL